jgi:hypothetical protein
VSVSHARLASFSRIYTAHRSPSPGGSSFALRSRRIRALTPKVPRDAECQPRGGTPSPSGREGSIPCDLLSAVSAGDRGQPDRLSSARCGVSKAPTALIALADQPGSLAALGEATSLPTTSTEPRPQSSPKFPARPQPRDA